MLYFICALPLVVGAIVFGLSYFLWWRSRWWIEPRYGSDRNHGHSELRPLKTHAECMRRVGRRVDSTITINILCDLHEPLMFDQEFGPNGLLHHIGIAHVPHFPPTDTEGRRRE